MANRQLREKNLSVALSGYKRLLAQEPSEKIFTWYYSNLLRAFQTLNDFDSLTYWKGLLPWDVKCALASQLELLEKKITKNHVQMSKKKKLVFSITTYNRIKYLKQCLGSFIKTRNMDYDWTVIIADDGSTDGTVEFLRNFCTEHGFYLIENKRRYCVGQTNTIFSLANNIGFSVGFKCDDDVVFVKPGWDDLYVNAIQATGFGHLCYLDLQHFLWNRKRENENYVLPEENIDRTGLLAARSDVYKSMGAFFTFTPAMLRSVGCCDERNFPIRGQWHIDFSIRCCRVNQNKIDTFYDARLSNDFLTLQNNIDQDYLCALPWNDEYKKTKESGELERRDSILYDKSRVYIPFLKTAKKATPCINDFFDKIYVLNLDRRADRWRLLQERISQYDIKTTRFSAIDGHLFPYKAEWQAYMAEPLPAGSAHPVTNDREYYMEYETFADRVRYIYNKTGSKPLGSPGAWGYLKSMEILLENAITHGYESVLVLDDDIICHKMFNNIFYEVVQQLPKDWYILQLGALQYEWDGWINWFSENLYHCNGSSIASHAVGIRRYIFHELLDLCHQIQMPFDEGALHRIKHKYRTKCFIAYPNLFIQDVSESDISTSKVQSIEGKKNNNAYRWKLTDYKENAKLAVCSDSIVNDIDKAQFFSKKNGHFKILHIRDSFSAPSETFIYDMICNMESKTALDNYVLTFNRILLEERPFRKTVEIDRNIIRDVVAQRKYVELVLKRLQPDVIIHHFGTTAIDMHELIGDSLLNYPQIISMHGYDIYEVPITRPGYLDAIKWLSRHDNVVVTYQTDYVLEKITSYLGIDSKRCIKVNVIGSDRYFYNRKKKFWSAGDDVNILNVARLVPWKGQRYLIEGFAEFVKNNEQKAHLTIVGSKDQIKKDLIKLVKDLDVIENITIYDYVTGDHLLKLFQNSDIYIHPSYVDPQSRMTESFGVALLEAIYIGLPVICTDAGGMPELVGVTPSEFYQIVPQKNASAIAHSIRYFVENNILSKSNVDYAINRRSDFSMQKQLQRIFTAIELAIPSYEGNDRVAPPKR